MTRLTRCDNCGKELEHTANWLEIRFPHQPHNQTILLDVCSAKCGSEYLAKWAEAGKE